MAHLYTKDGQPRFTVPKADGKGMRDARISDAERLDLYVSVTEKIKSTLHPGW